jgi:hypothetical protein
MMRGGGKKKSTTIINGLSLTCFNLDGRDFVKQILKKIENGEKKMFREKNK